MARYYVFTFIVFAGFVSSNSACRAQVISDYFFTTDPVTKLESNSGFGEGAIKNSQQIMQRCVRGLVLSGNQESYVDCIKKAQKSFSLAITSSRPKILDSCKSAGYTICFNSRLAASIVQVESPVSGTGVVIGDDGKSYLIATSRHVVDGIAKGETGDIVWQNKMIGTFSLTDVWKSPDFDLAIIRIKSKAVIPIVPIAQATIQITGQPISVAGFPLGGGLNKGENKVLRISRGTISSQAPSASATEGYSISYTAPTTAGMSGGGVFATTTCKQAGPVIVASPIPLLVGIHGRAEKSEAKGSTGFNFAVPAWSINSYPAIKEFQNQEKSRANFGCPNGYDSRMEFFTD